MRSSASLSALSSFLLASAACLSLGCSLDTAKFSFEESAGAPGAAGSGGGTDAGAAGASLGGESGAAGAGAAGEAGTGGSAGTSGAGAAGVGGAGGDAGAGAGGDAGGGAGGAGAGAGGGGGGGAAGATGGTAGASGSGGSGVTCVTMLAGAQRCADKTIETCVATNEQDPSAEGTWTPEAQACELGCNQVGIHASCAVCVPGSKLCDDQGVATCDTTGAGYTTATCSAQLTCDDTLLTCVACTPGKPVCAGSTSIPCSDSGTLIADQAADCGSAALCSAGVGCTKATCLPSDFQCADAGKSVQRCLGDGTGFQPPEPCGAGEACYDSVGCAACDPADAKPRCVGDDVAFCDGGKLQITAKCAANACSVDHCLTCDEGSVQCSLDGTQIQSCVGGVLSAPTTCVSGTHCSVAVKKCVLCEPKSVFCDGDTLSTCSDDGSSIVNKKVCGAGLCDSLRQECDECAGTTRRCEGDQAQTCDSSGHFVTTDTCATKALCEPTTGTCQEPACKLDQTACGAGKAPLICNADRTDFVPNGDKCELMCFATDGCAKVSSVVAGPGASCAIVDTKDTSGAVVCWGNNPNIPGIPGATLFGGTAGVIGPRRVSGLQDIRKIVLGNDFACVLSEKGAVSCWGAGGQGRLGLGDEASRGTPTELGLGGVFDLSVSPLGGSCAIAGDQTTVSCWGPRATASGQGDFATKPELVSLSSDMLPVRSIDVTNSHRCILGNESIYCWGFGGSGQLGNNTTTNASKPSQGQVLAQSGSPTGPLQLVALSGATGVHVADGGGVGRAASCGMAKGRLFCWGSNSAGQLGSGTQLAVGANRPFAAEVNPPLDNVLEFGVGNEFACANIGGQVACWGTEVGGRNGLISQRTSPTAISKTLSGVSSLSVGLVHSCVIGTDSSQPGVPAGAVYCWGDNGAGQLGVPPSQVSSSAKATAVLFPDSL